MTDKNYRLSIIIPTFNVEDYIQETLTSCLNQDISQEEYEIICIDDGSSDATVSKIEEIASANKNIKLFTQKNSGVSATRNRGIDLARGNYIWFVDSDDLIAPNCIGPLLNKVEEYEAEKLLFGMEHFTTQPKAHNQQVNFEFCDTNDKMYAFVYSHNGGGVCRSFYKTEFLRQNELRFNTKLAFSEDIFFDFAVLINCQKCLKTENVSYFYRQRIGSAMHSNNFDKHISSMQLLAKEYLSITKKDIPKSWKKLSKRKSQFAIKALLFSLVQKGDIKYAKECLNELKKEGLYPYPFLNILFNNKAFKELIINWISFFFPFKWYFLLCVRIVSFKKLFKK